MLRVECELLLGTFRGSGGDDLTLAGGVGSVEWPPSPARLFAALVAAGGGGAVRDRGALAALEAGPPPTIDASTRLLVTRLEDRFVVDDERRRGSVHEYPARSSLPVRMGSRVAPADPRVTYWWDVELDAPQCEELAERCARVGYLGTSDSPARLSMAKTDEGRGAWRPAPHGSRVLGVPSQGYLAQLDNWFDRWSQGEMVRRSWIPTARERYASPDEAAPSRDDRMVIHLSMEHPVGGRFVRRLAEALRGAVNSKHEELFGPGSAPAVLHGHPMGVEHAMYLPLPSVGHPHADGRIRGLAVVLPPGVSPQQAGRVRQAVGSVSRLFAGRAFDVGVAPHDGARRPWAGSPDRWREAATVFSTAFPFVHDRYVKGGPSLDDLAAWAAHAGLPRPKAVRHSRVPMIAGAIDLMPHEVHRPGFRGPYGHLWIEFSQPVRGPVALGRLRHFGLGLLVPLNAGAGGGA